MVASDGAESLSSRAEETLEQQGGRTHAFVHTAIILAIAQLTQMVYSQQRSHTHTSTHWCMPLINSGGVDLGIKEQAGFFLTTASGSHSCLCLIESMFFQWCWREVHSLLMLVCWPTSVSFISTEGVEPKRGKDVTKAQHRDTIPHAPVSKELPANTSCQTAAQGNGHGTDRGNSAQLLIQKYVQPTPAHIAKCAQAATGTTGHRLKRSSHHESMKCHKERQQRNLWIKYSWSGSRRNKEAVLSLVFHISGRKLMTFIQLPTKPQWSYMCTYW